MATPWEAMVCAPPVKMYFVEVSTSVTLAQNIALQPEIQSTKSPESNQREKHARKVSIALHWTSLAMSEICLQSHHLVLPFPSRSLSVPCFSMPSVRMKQLLWPPVYWLVTGLLHLCMLFLGKQRKVLTFLSQLHNGIAYFGYFKSFLSKDENILSNTFRIVPAYHLARKRPGYQQQRFFMSIRWEL